MPARTLMYYTTQKIHDKNEQEAWRVYMADMAWAPASEMKYQNMPKYTEYIERLKGKPDDRTADEIVDGVISDFMGD